MISSKEEKEIGKIKRWNRIILILVILFVVIPLMSFFVFVHIFNYGFQASSCVYKEKTLLIPNTLEGATIVFGDKYTLHKPENYGECAPILNSVKYWMSDSSSGSNYIAKGTQMNLKYIIARTKYGIGTVDSGGGPWFEFVLGDEKGNLYSINSNYLNGPYESIAIYKGNQKVEALSESQLELLYLK